MRSETKKIATKAVCGVAGITCNCCRGYKTVKLARVAHNRAVRRAANITLRALRNAEME